MRGKEYPLLAAPRIKVYVVYDHVTQFRSVGGCTEISYVAGRPFAIIATYEEFKADFEAVMAERTSKVVILNKVAYKVPPPIFEYVKECIFMYGEKKRAEC